MPDGTGLRLAVEQQVIEPGSRNDWEELEQLFHWENVELLRKLTQCGDLEERSRALEAILKQQQAWLDGFLNGDTTSTGVQDGEGVKIQRVRSQTQIDTSFAGSEKSMTERIACDQVRVLETVYFPQQINTELSIGSWLLGLSLYNKIRMHYYHKNNGFIGRMSTAYWFVSAATAILQMSQVLSYSIALDLFCAFGMFHCVIFFLLDLNRKICKLLVSRFDVWFNVLNSAGFCFSILVLLRGKGVYSWGIGFLGSSCIVWFTDAMTLGKRKVACKYIFPMIIVVTSLIQFGLWLDWYYVRHYTVQIGGLEWTASGHTNQSLTYLTLFLVRYFLTSLAHPDNLLVLKAPITSRKQRRSMVDIKRQIVSCATSQQQNQANGISGFKHEIETAYPIIMSNSNFFKIEHSGHSSHSELQRCKTRFLFPRPSGHCESPDHVEHRSHEPSFNNSNLLT